jgi:thiamine pyrophosphokinase
VESSALLILNSVLPPSSVLIPLVERNELIVCADGGANRAREAGLAPHVILGDLDSLTEETKRSFPAATIIHRPDQEKTDLHKSLEFLEEKKITKLDVVGVDGRRFDHALSNLSVLERFSSRLQIEIHTELGIGFFLNAGGTGISKSFKVTPQSDISLLSFGGAHGIVTENLAWPLNDESLEWSIRDGTSNRATTEHVSISLKRGVLFVFIPRIL